MNMLVRKVLLVDALVDGPFSGAPTHVVFLEAALDKFKMVSLAHELGTGETVFALAHHKSFLLRFFNQLQEVPLGGHACHAVAHLIYELGLMPPAEPVFLLTQEGEITARLTPPSLITVNFPALSLAKMDQAALDLQGSILGLPAKDLAWGAMTPTRQAILAVDPKVPLKKLEPDRERLKKSGASSLAATVIDPQAGEYSLRCFSANPQHPEQQVSVNIHRSLAPHLGRLLQKRRLIARQLSSRGSRVQLDVGAPGQVGIAGTSRTILRADLVPELLGDVPVTILGPKA
jgi:predicted PhzF superfamily epimerase YddE/YHI9